MSSRQDADQHQGDGSRDEELSPAGDGRRRCSGAEERSRTNGFQGARLRQRSIQIAGKLLERHTKHPSRDNTEATPLSTELPYDRSASPTLSTHDEDDNVHAAIAGPPEGVLGLILDLHRIRGSSQLQSGPLDEPDLPQTSTGSRGPRLDAGRSQEYERLRKRPENTGGDNSSAESSFASIRSALSEEPGGKIPRPTKQYTEAKNEHTVGYVASAIRSHIIRHLYLIKLCRALMTFGAPTHRLTAYMTTSARALGVDAQFMYLPHCMFMSFTDNATQTTKVSIVTAPHGMDLGRMRDAHFIYMLTAHRMISVDEAMDRLEEVITRRPKFNNLVRLLMYGCATACVGPFGFQARPIDLPILFCMGCLLGGLQLLLAPSNTFYSSVFEITAAIIMSFIGRAIGTIHGGSLFCFSALTQSSIALILPGYVVLCATLELQTKQLVAGGVRIVWATIYTLFLGYGITIGSLLYAYMDKNAVSDVNCESHLPRRLSFPFVAGFTISVAIINQAKWTQMPLMMFISLCGYVVNWRASVYFKGASTISSTLGALTVGVLGNLYSRLGRYPWCLLDAWQQGRLPFLKHRRKKDSEGQRDLEKGPDDANRQDPPPKRFEAQVGYGLSAAAMLPAILVQVPSGLAVGGSLLSGVTTADWIVSEQTGTTAIEDITSAQGVAFSVTLSVVQVAISASVGLSLATLFAYPLSRQKSHNMGFTSF